MINKLYKTKVSELIKKAKEKEAIKEYSKFCDTKKGKETALSEEEIIYYTSQIKGETK